MSARRATIADVAREAGVSPSTASVVFSGKTQVTDATRQRVLAAASALGYTGPDPRAASLRPRRSGIIGVVLGGRLRSAFLDPVTTVVLDGISEGIAPLDAAILLLRDDATETGPSLMTAPIDGAVLLGCSAHMRSSLDDVRGRGIPVVVIEGDAGEGVPQIGLDNEAAQRHIAEYTKGLGHERVVHVTMAFDASTRAGWAPSVDLDAITVDVTRDRLRGALEVYPDAPIYHATGSLIDEGYAAGQAILALDPRPTAAIAQTDLLAVGIVRAALDAGVRVPEDFSVTGFDGIRADGIAPHRLTTMAQPAADKGRAAGEVLAALIQGTPTSGVDFASRFREGNTTGPAPQA
jgi:DNA-binding LacI/PurR family transcriptional regulator